MRTNQPGHAPERISAEMATLLREADKSQTLLINNKAMSQQPWESSIPQYILNMNDNDGRGEDERSPDRRAQAAPIRMGESGGRKDPQSTFPSSRPNSPKTREEDEEDSRSEISHISRDSFDWIGDDREQAEEEGEEFSFLEESAGELVPPPSGEGPCGLQSLIPANFTNDLLLVLFVGLLVLLVATSLGFHLPSIGGVSMRTWMAVSFTSIFTPIWIHTGIGHLVRQMKASALFSRTEHHARLLAIQGHLTLLLSTFVVASIWLFNIPITCPRPESIVIPPSSSSSPASSIPDAEAATISAITSASSQEPFLEGAPPCLYASVPRLFLFLAVSAVVFILLILLLRELRSSFQERTFKSRFIESRFKVFVVDKLLEVAQETRQHGRSMRSSAQSVTSSTATSRSRPRRPTVRSYMFDLPFIIPKHLVQLIRSLTGGRSYIRVMQGGEDQYQAGPPRTELTSSFSIFRQSLLKSIQSAGYESVAHAPPRTDLEAKRMARMIFHYLCPEDRNYLVIGDFTSIFPSTAACSEAYYIFDRDRDGTITKGEFRGAVVRIFRQQRNLAQSISNTGSAFSILDSMAMWLAGAGLFLLLLALIGVRVTSILAVSGSIVLGLNFIVFDGANKTFHAILFLFFMHPYDIGDRIVVGKDVPGGEEDILTVVHINIQNTVFRRWNGLEVSTPNHLLALTTVTNLSRTTELWERIDFELPAPEQQELMDLEEETERLGDLRRRIDAFVHAYPNDYYQSFDLRAVIAADSAKGDQCLDRLKFTLRIRCRETVDSQKRWIRHARILAFVKQTISSVAVGSTAGAAHAA